MSTCCNTKKPFWSQCILCLDESVQHRIWASSHGFFISFSQLLFWSKTAFPYSFMSANVSRPKFTVRLQPCDPQSRAVRVGSKCAATCCERSDRLFLPSIIRRHSGEHVNWYLEGVLVIEPISYGALGRSGVFRAVGAVRRVVRRCDGVARAAVGRRCRTRARHVRRGEWTALHILTRLGGPGPWILRIAPFLLLLLHRTAVTFLLNPVYIRILELPYSVVIFQGREYTPTCS